MTYATIRIDLDEVDTDDLIEEIEDRGYSVNLSGKVSEDTEALHRTLDEIHNLYQAFTCWKDFGMKDSTFESDLKKFFLETIDVKVI